MAPNSTFSSEPQPGPEPTRLFFQERYASKLGVRGNFLPLAAKPENVDLGEWLAHQSKLFLFAYFVLADFESRSCRKLPPC